MVVRLIIEAINKVYKAITSEKPSEPNLGLPNLVIFIPSEHRPTQNPPKKSTGKCYIPVKVLQSLPLAFECSNLFPKPIDSWPMGTVSLPKYNRLEFYSVECVLETALITLFSLTHPHKAGSPGPFPDYRRSVKGTRDQVITDDRTKRSKRLT